MVAALVVREGRATTPLMPLRVFRSRTLAGANATQMLMPAALFGMFFLGALYLQRVLGYDALQIGLAFLPYTVVQGTLSVRSTDRLIARLGARRLIAIGIVPFAAGLEVLTRAATDASYALDLLPAMVMMGAGGGLGFPPIMTLATSNARLCSAWRPRPRRTCSGSAQAESAPLRCSFAPLATLATPRSSRSRRAGCGGQRRALKRRSPPRRRGGLRACEVGC
jgi:Major Facilitator Superfamily